jgi:LysR family transcriptional regulator, regulator for metE and metH
VNRIAEAKPALDVRDLELVLALAESGSTVRAASRLHVTQSAVSRGLLAVEDKLGAKLFERVARGLVPTPAGHRLVAGAGPVLGQLVELEHHARAGTNGRVVLRVVSECYTAYRWLPSTLAKLRPVMSSLDITLAFEHTAAPVAALQTGDVDVALLTTGKVTGGVIEQPLFEDEIVFVVAATHPLADRAALTVSDLRAFPLITSTSTPQPEQRWFAGRVFGKTSPRVDYLRFPLTEAIIDAARAGMGIAVMSEWIATPYLAAGDLVVKRLRGKPLERPWRIAYRRESSDAARQLMTAIAGAAPRVAPVTADLPARKAGRSA